LHSEVNGIVDTSVITEDVCWQSCHGI